MEINGMKSKFMILSNRNVRSTYDDNDNIMINNKYLVQIIEIKYLSVVIYKNLNTHCHTKNLMEKISKQQGLLSRKGKNVSLHTKILPCK